MRFTSPHIGLGGYRLLVPARLPNEVGLKLTHVHEIMTNPFYDGRLSDGTPSALGRLLAPATWDKVQMLR